MKITLKRNRKSNETGFIVQSLKVYIKASTPKELSFDWIFPLVLSIAVFTLMFYLSDSNLQILKIIEKINSTAINVIAILAGFNTASLAVITSSNRELLNKLNTTISPSEKVEFSKPSLFKRMKLAITNNTKSNTLKITINFFCYAVIIQLIALIFGLLASAMYDFLPNIQQISFFSLGDLTERFVLLIYGVFWLTLILHSVFISLRNVEMVYQFIMYKDKVD